MHKIFFLLLIFSFSAFSNECKLIETTVNYLAQNKLKGRVPETYGNKQARNFLKKKLRDLGLKVFEHKFKQGVNLYATMYPKNARGNKSPEVLLSAHYDGLDSCDRKLGAGSNICNGAADDAAALAAILASLTNLKEKIKSPILIIFFDAEETGLLGSNALVKDSKKLNLHLKGLKLMINLDIIGLNLFTGMENTLLAMGGETGGKKLLNDLNEASKISGLDVYNLSYALTHNRADVSSLINAKLKVPVIHLTSGDGSVYHSTADEVRYLNQDKISKTSKLVTALTLRALQSAKKYRFKRPKMFSGYALPKFTDVKLGKKLIKNTLVNKSLNQFTTSELNQLKNMIDSLTEIEKRGKIRFGPKNMQKFANISFKYMGFSREMDVIPSGSNCQ